MPKRNSGTLESIIDAIIEHDRLYPDHGVGCACHDGHAGAIRRLIQSKGLYGEDRKSLNNLIVVMAYIIRNP